ncbi:MAG: acyl-protein synthetase [Myxococcales bacterium]|nr:acyl-protein synthetase [Myxococcales bacterium]
MTREVLKGRIEALIDGRPEADARDGLLEDLLQLQARHIEVYRRLLEQGSPAPAAARPFLSSPALPTDVFRFARAAMHPSEQDVRVFRTSGTTAAARGAHHLRDLSLYDRAARTAARHMLFPDRESMPLLILAPRAEELPDSSLSYMLSRFDQWFGDSMAVYALRNGQLDGEALCTALARSQQSGEPLALLGTSFAFVHADELLAHRRFSLPSGSRIMQTGGFKGRSRELSPSQMLQMLSQRYGIGESFIIAEYGMTEMSSQLYETPLRAALGLEAEGPRRLWVPPWVRATPVDPHTLEPLDSDAEGILRIDDAANLDTPCAIQTSDRARRLDDGVQLLGRAEGATPRGCSLAIDAALSRS